MRINEVLDELISNGKCAVRNDTFPFFKLMLNKLDLNYITKINGNMTFVELI